MVYTNKGDYFMNYIEAEILKYIASMVSNPFFDGLFEFISILGNKGALWIILSLAMLMFKKTRKAGICCALSLVICLILGNLILKPLVGRIRPYNFDKEIQIIIPPLLDGSFPSGHTMASFAFASSLRKYFKKAGLFALIVAVFMGLSRIYLCVHYPTDVLAGALFGIGFGMISYKINERLFPQ